MVDEHLVFRLSKLNKKVVDVVAHEKKWIMLEASFLMKLEEAVKAKDILLAQRYEKLCARTHRREHRFVAKVFHVLEATQKVSQHAYEVFLEVEKKIKIYEKLITVKVAKPIFGEKGKISCLLWDSNINWSGLEKEVNDAYSKGVAPLLALLDELIGDLKSVEEFGSHSPFKESEMMLFIIPKSRDVVERYVQSVFPKTYTLSLALAKSAGVEHYSSGHIPEYVHDKSSRSTMLLMLATLFNNNHSPIQPGEAIALLKKRLKGKKILSLGDDTGSLTEILQHFGCKTLGIEFDKDKVSIAHSGKLSEDERPRPDVIQGDIWELTLDDSALLKVVGKGKYDAIVSDALFNGGSGGENPRGEVESQLRSRFFYYQSRSGPNSDPLRDQNLEFWLWFFNCQTRRLLKKNGIQLHLQVEFRDDFELYKRDNEPEDTFKNESELYDRIVKKNGCVKGEFLIDENNHRDNTFRIY